jgi:beta-xylosidase
MSYVNVLRSFCMMLTLGLGASAADASKAQYVFAFFRDNGEAGVHLALSGDALNWRELNGGKPVLFPQVGGKLTRDPSICRGPDGAYHMVWTTSWKGDGFGVAHSTNLLDWSEQAYVAVNAAEPNARNTWAPEIFFDDATQQYVVLWATTITGLFPETQVKGDGGLNHRIYCATTADFKKWTPKRLFYDGGFNVIDAFLFKKDGKYGLVVKDETVEPAPAKNLHVVWSEGGVMGPWGKVGPAFTDNRISWAEGPAVIQVGDRWLVYFDMYNKRRYGVVETRDFATFAPVQVTLPAGIKHGTIIEVDAATAQGLALRERRVEWNPVVPDTIADPTVVNFDGTYYLYATTDVDQELRVAGIPVVWKSKDLLNWSFDGQLMPDLDWTVPTRKYWAPGRVLRRQEKGAWKYYLYFTCEGPTHVAVADAPEGPFKLANGDNSEIGKNKAKGVVPDIDGCPFIDDDGKAYIFWRKRHAARLRDDWAGIDGEQVTLKTRCGAYSEGPFMIKRQGVYYYFYTLSGCTDYRNAYMMSTVSPLGPFTTPEQDVVVMSDLPGGVWGPGHGFAFQTPGADEWFFTYLEFGMGGTTRQVYIDRMEFSEDGTVRPVKVSRLGIGPQTGVRDFGNLAEFATVETSSVRPVRVSKARLAPCHYPGDAPKGTELLRAESYIGANAMDASNGTRWWADGKDKAPWLKVDLGEVKEVGRCEMAFIFPTRGHAWALERSEDGQAWTVCGRQREPVARSPHVADGVGPARYLRVNITAGDAGLWSFKAFRK